MKKTILFIAIFCFQFSVLKSFSQGSAAIHLEDSWQFRKTGDAKWLPASVPGTVHTDLLNNKLIDDPFYGDNEKKLQWIDTCHWEYQTFFDCDSVTFNSQHIELQFDGLDTYTKVFLNDVLILTADNMFRTWRADCKSLLKENNNHLLIQFEPAVAKGKELAKKLSYTLPGDEKVFTRKAAYQYGWDWAPRFVTCGIWRPVSLTAWSSFKVNDIKIVQDELVDSVARLVAEVNITSDELTTIYFSVLIPGVTTDTLHLERVVHPGENISNLPFTIRNPKRWWSNGLGEPFLYHVSVITSLPYRQPQIRTMAVGLRTIELIQKEDSIGRSFYFKLNGIPVFMKGANYIPADNFLPRVTEQRYHEIIQSAAEANMNMLRVWGGGTYEDDKFYSLCDEKGILVWQDFMFACAMYPGDSLFLENAKQEAIDNVKRLRNHPCIALWCGNNEIDEGWKNWEWQKQFHYSDSDSVKIERDYQKLFEDVLPEVIRQQDPLIAYVPSSPLFGWGHPESLTQGDSHYWGVWWGSEPFDMYTKKVGRFMSEYGFQGMPSYNMFKKFMDEKDLSLTSDAMKNHQKHPAGFETIQKYLDRDFKQPKDFESYIYVSQLLQAEGLKTAIEAHRRAKATCMGTLYWQLNDCWPVTSWSSTDYDGNWKALHYTVKEAYQKYLITAKKKGENIVVSVVSDDTTDLNARFRLQLIDFTGNILWKDSGAIFVKDTMCQDIYVVPLSELLYNVQESRVFLKMEIEKDKKVITRNNYYFVEPKKMMLDKPVIKHEITSAKGNKFNLILSSNALAKNVMIDFPGLKIKISDNYFDLLPGEKKIISVEGNSSVKELTEKIKLKSLVDTY